MSGTGEVAGAASATAAKNKSVNVIGIIVIVIGVGMIVAGIATYSFASLRLSTEKITVAEDAAFLAGKEVKGPFTAMAQADIISTHTENITGGKTYAEIPREEAELRNTAMQSSFLQASLFTSVIAFGVSALVVVLGIVFALLGFALIRVSRE